MKFPLLWHKRLLALAGTVSLLAASCYLAQAEPSVTDAQAAAHDWIALIDAGQYTDSYAAGCIQFHRKVTQEKWELVLKAFRPSFGPVVSRKEINHVYSADGVNGLDGQCMVITYDTSFQHLQGGFEKVVLKLEDGKWRGAAYMAGPKPGQSNQADLPPPQVQTDVQTTQTQHPQ